MTDRCARAQEVRRALDGGHAEPVWTLPHALCAGALGTVTTAEARGTRCCVALMTILHFGIGVSHTSTRVQVGEVDRSYSPPLLLWVANR
jgi:hypothetical protein